MSDDSLRAVLESCLDKRSEPPDIWCEICKRWEGSNKLHSDWCPVPAFALAVARLEAAEEALNAVVMLSSEQWCLRTAKNIPMRMGYKAERAVKRWAALAL